MLKTTANRKHVSNTMNADGNHRKPKYMFETKYIGMLICVLFFMLFSTCVCTLFIFLICFNYVRVSHWFGERGSPKPLNAGKIWYERTQYFSFLFTFPFGISYDFYTNLRFCAGFPMCFIEYNGFRVFLRSPMKDYVSHMFFYVFL